MRQPAGRVGGRGDSRQGPTSAPRLQLILYVYMLYVCIYIYIYMYIYIYRERDVYVIGYIVISVVLQ